MSFKHGVSNVNIVEYKIMFKKCFYTMRNVRYAKLGGPIDAFYPWLCCFLVINLLTKCQWVTVSSSRDYGAYY